MAPTRELPAPGLLASMWRFKWISLAIAGGVMVLSGLAGVLLAPSPTASATLTLKNPGASNLLAQGVVGDASLTRYTKQRADFITSDDVLTVVAQAVPQYSVTDLRQDIVVSTTSASNQLTITASGRTAADAVQLANVVVDSYRQATAAQVRRLTDDAIASIDATRAELLKPVKGSRSLSPSVPTTIAQLDQQKSSLQTDSSVFNDGVDFVQRASLDDAVAPGIPYRYLAAGLVFGLVVAALVAWLRADRHRFVDDEEDVEPMLDAPLLGSVVLARKQDGAAPPPSLRQYRLISAALSERAHAVVAVVETGEGAERLEVVASLATALASDGARLLLIDADPQSQVSARMWGNTPQWLRSQPDDEELDGTGRAIARHATDRGGEPAAPTRTPPTVAETPAAAPAPDTSREPAPVGLAAGVGSAAQALRTAPPEVKAIALPTLALPTVGPKAEQRAEQSAESKAETKVETKAEMNGHSRDEAALAGAELDAAEDGQPIEQAPVQRVPLRGDLGLDLISIGRWKPAARSDVRREFVDKVAEAAKDYDLVLLDLPAPDSSPIVPALLRISTGLLAVVPHGTEERAVERVRRAAAVFSTPVLGYVFTRVRK